MIDSSTRRLRGGDLILLGDKPWLVERANDSSAFVIPVFGEKATIRTRLGLEKQVERRRAGMHIAVTSYVPIIDPDSPHARQLKECYNMSTETLPTEEKRVRKQREGLTYVHSGKEVNPKLGGQGLIVINKLIEMGPTTSTALAAACDGAFSTRQPVSRVVAFYLAKFKREGLVVAVTPDEQAAAGADVPEITE